MMEPVAYLREAGFRSLAEGCHTSAMPTDVDEYNIPVVRLSDAEARIDRLTRELAEAREALAGMLQYAGIIEERCGNVETVRARRALKEKP